jgi:hypothetical protein
MDDMLAIRLSSQVQALELVLKTMITFQLNATVADETGFAKAAELSGQIKERLETYITGRMAAAKALPVHDAELAAAVERGMRETVARCFDQPQAMMTQIAAIILDLSKPASHAKN